MKKVKINYEWIYDRVYSIIILYDIYKRWNVLQSNASMHMNQKPFYTLYHIPLTKFIVENIKTYEFL